MTGTAKEKSSKKNHLIKSSWNLGKTGTIRIPIKIKEQILGIARSIDDGEMTVFNEGVNENRETILSQDNIDEIIAILKHGITSKRRGGVYDSSNASPLKIQVNKALAILQEFSTDA
ncbi:MAG: hypothetical protein ACRC80_14645 [Waterburya sp.]|jgi:hypothetical protein